jgi:hypothetical protein
MLQAQSNQEAAREPQATPGDPHGKRMQPKHDMRKAMAHLMSHAFMSIFIYFETYILVLGCSSHASLKPKCSFQYPSVWETSNSICISKFPVSPSFPASVFSSFWFPNSRQNLSSQLFGFQPKAKPKTSRNHKKLGNQKKPLQTNLQVNPKP